MWATLLFYTFVVAAALQSLYFLLIFSKLAFRKKEKHKTKTSAQEAVSIIICAKNEAQNLKENLPGILNQNYTNFEIVLINDASTDNTLAVMEGFAAKHPHVKIVDVASNETFWGNKKYALTLGIKAATYNHLLFTDADCKPQTDYWLAEMANCFSSQKTIVLGYSPYAYIKKSFVNILIRFETMLTGLQYISYAAAGIPYMGVGRNLAYHRSEFFRANGFVEHIKLLSGDDDLFVNQVATKANTAICLSPQSFMVSKPKRTFPEWFRQKRRHVSTANRYKAGHKILLSLYFISNVLFWVLIPVLISLSIQLFWVLSIALSLILIKCIVYKGGFKKLGDTSLWWWSPVLEIFLITIQFAIFIANSISKPTHWK